jgi:hypothetical protein
VKFNPLITLNITGGEAWKTAGALFEEVDVEESAEDYVVYDSLVEVVVLSLGKDKPGVFYPGDL